MQKTVMYVYIFLYLYIIIYPFIFQHKFGAHLSMTNEPFHWAWDSELPLECESHSVRIRSAPSRSKEERWSAWSAWKTHYGQFFSITFLLITLFVIYPHEKIVPEGSNVSFCCIPSKGERVTKMKYGVRRGLTYDVPNGSAGTFVITVSNVKMSASDGTNVIYEPSNISCETSDMKILTCTWSPGSLYNFQQNGNGDGKLNPKYTMYERFTNITTYCQARNSCVWTIERSQSIYNFTLTAENRLGRESVNIVVNVSENGMETSAM
uniref:Leukemia inhibitory factor receptor D2 domain-containing protein n=1 Tax=Leptobrachium leishanense TaxID=445787 RepID=A0A8C5LTU4_9ANUR